MQISVQYPNFHYMSGEWFSLSNFMNKMMIFSYGYVYPDEDDVDEKGKATIKGTTEQVKSVR